MIRATKKAAYAAEIRTILRQVPKPKLNKMLRQPFTDRAMQIVSFEVVIQTAFADLPDDTHPDSLRKSLGIPS